jgi:DNA-binding transcriptional MocR family regulator
MVAWLPPDWDARALSHEASRLGVAALPLDPYYQQDMKRDDVQHGEARRSGLMLGFAALDEQRIHEGVRRLAQAAERCRGRRLAPRSRTAGRDA